jgi:hypothetical protein
LTWKSPRSKSELLLKNMKVLAFNIKEYIHIKTKYLSDEIFFIIHHSRRVFFPSLKYKFLWNKQLKEWNSYTGQNARRFQTFYEGRLARIGSHQITRDLLSTMNNSWLIMESSRSINIVKKYDTFYKWKGSLPFIIADNFYSVIDYSKLQYGG